MSSQLFQYQFRFHAEVDQGLQRSSNQDAVILCPEHGFFAVSDGMGGLRYGGETSRLLARTLPDCIRTAREELAGAPSPEKAAVLLAAHVRRISGDIAARLNLGSRAEYGATLCGVWLVGNHAVFVNLGDSRGYVLGFREQRIRQITQDHNMAAQLVALGQLSPQEARGHVTGSMLTGFVGMADPALPETFVEDLRPGDRILLCSDGLHGMLEDAALTDLLRSSKSLRQVTRRLVDEANNAGGRDNIAVVSIAISGQNRPERQHP